MPFSCFKNFTLKKFLIAFVSVTFVSTLRYFFSLGVFSLDPLYLAVISFSCAIPFVIFEYIGNSLIPYSLFKYISSYWRLNNLNLSSYIDNIKLGFLHMDSVNYGNGSKGGNDGYSGGSGNKSETSNPDKPNKGIVVYTDSNVDNLSKSQNNGKGKELVSDPSNEKESKSKSFPLKPTKEVITSEAKPNITRTTATTKQYDPVREAAANVESEAPKFDWAAYLRDNPAMAYQQSQLEKKTSLWAFNGFDWPQEPQVQTQEEIEAREKTTHKSKSTESDQTSDAKRTKVSKRP